MKKLVDSASLVVTHLGKEVPYADGMRVMRERMADVSAAPSGPAHLLLLEHAPTITVTRTGGTAHLLCRPEDLADDGIDLVETDRGGDVTFHGPGQLVGYPILSLARDASGRADLVGYLRALEAALVAACTRLGVAGCFRREGMTGVWVASDPNTPASTWAHDSAAKKLVAIGVGVKSGVTRHGFALNVDIDLERYTSRIVPCGLVGHGVTRLLDELHALPDEASLLEVITEELAKGLDVPLASPTRALTSVDESSDRASSEEQRFPRAHGPDGVPYG